MTLKKIAKSMVKGVENSKTAKAVKTILPTVAKVGKGINKVADNRSAAKLKKADADVEKARIGIKKAEKSEYGKTAKKMAEQEYKMSLKKYGKVSEADGKVYTTARKVDKFLSKYSK